jgi:hypothetical protein
MLLHERGHSEFACHPPQDKRHTSWKMLLLVLQDAEQVRFPKDVLLVLVLHVLLLPQLCLQVFNLLLQLTCGLQAIEGLLSHALMLKVALATQRRHADMAG